MDLRLSQMTVPKVVVSRLRRGAPLPSIGEGLGTLRVLSNEVLMHIFECCEIETIAMLLTIPSFAALILTNLPSICKGMMRENKLHEDVIRAGYVGDLLRQRGGNPGEARRLLAVGTLPAVDAVERRNVIVETILDSHTFPMRMDSKWPRCDNMQQRKNLRKMLREGIRICDRLADFEGEVIATANAKFFASNPLPLTSVELESAILQRYSAAGMVSHLPTVLALRKKRYVRWQLRSLQGGFIQTCTTYQLYCVAVLLRLANERAGPTRPNPSTISRRHPYQSGINEAALRHGSWFLQCFGSITTSMNPGRYEHAIMVGIAAGRDVHDCAQKQGLRWGGIMQDELTVVLEKELRSRLPFPDEQPNLDVAVLVRIDEIIRGRQTVLPMTFMFAQE
ncbi:hypothetical protein JDV02_001598 [Purpureocillium takamizusanense]|uniref:Uncharacterized protein n=1 Tax=Purpureocillium takamizusanense TaxID=2060973 RepID=A0A9Q8Q8M2_9HYPO|nr:uncharacterized protein JDV02_001598 [Purpureocillium takamizusanense]UNI15025.1 hypothetical protein JDV02_001598 [Purpureocillium takamizusanense]